MFQGDPIFIGGDGRSGTTLLSVVLDSHPLLVVGPELHFGGPENLGPYVLECCELIVKGDPRVFGAGLKENPRLKLGVQFAKRCHRFGIPFEVVMDLVREQMARTRSDLRRFEDRCVLIDALGEWRRAQTGSSRWGIKIMREIGKIPQYASLWPRAQFVHIIRDGRDVAASQMAEHGTWGYGSIREAAKSWAGMIDAVRKHARKHPVHELRYEDLVGDPEPTLRRLVEFLGVPWDPALLRHQEVEHSLMENPYHHPSIKSVVKPINTSAVGRYLRDLSAEQIEQFERLAGGHLRDLGYATGVGQPA